MIGKQADPPDIDMFLQPSTDPVKPQERPAEPIKMFCARRDVARALLRDLILWTGAFKEVEIGQIEVSQMKILAIKVQDFFIGLGDQLMGDTGLTETDITDITKELASEMQKKGS